MGFGRMTAKAEIPPANGNQIKALPGRVRSVTRPFNPQLVADGVNGTNLCVVSIRLRKISFCRITVTGFAVQLSLFLEAFKAATSSPITKLATKLFPYNAPGSPKGWREALRHNRHPLEGV
jgi:hypothetical protein